MEQVEGLSPRVRGNHHLPALHLGYRRSIPACTGEPHSCRPQSSVKRVYPRVYGGTRPAAPSSGSTKGLSPRVRGNPRTQTPASPLWGSIPACTGEPYDMNLSPSYKAVYPRVYGGTSRTNQPASPLRGLSPRVRGNPLADIGGGGWRRSIPACTGEPSRATLTSAPSRVYPRVYGGTHQWRSAIIRILGLSPRVRGNRLPAVPIPDPARSIPACTGEPLRRPDHRSHIRVYPRVYGGTVAHLLHPRRVLGLSPRVRGNPVADASRRGWSGSIPACTGEPIRAALSGVAGRVYPRVYGGTFTSASRLATISGLSPRVRGNRHHGKTHSH